jgi:stringent starvation protein B
MRQCLLLKRPCAHRLMASNKGYLVRAIYDWCVDSSLTPFLISIIDQRTQIPKSLSQDKEAIFNLSPSATSKLLLDNEFISFSARFNGQSEDIYLPIDCIKGIYAKENGEGLFFEVSARSDESLNDKKPQSKAKKSHLRLVK